MHSILLKSYAVGLAIGAQSSPLLASPTAKLAPGVPIQIHEGEFFSNGTEVIYDLLNPDAPPQIVQHALQTNGSTAEHPHGVISKRRTHCGDHGVTDWGTDSAVAAFKEYLRNTESGHHYLSSQDSSKYIWFRGGNVILYACLAERYSLWPVTERDLNLGLYNTDIYCGRYQSGYLAGEGLGANSRRIGKADLGRWMCRA